MDLSDLKRRPGGRLVTLLACIAISFAPGLIGRRFAPGEWYEGLARSPLTPPGWVFPIAWSALYLTMGLALFLFVDRARRGHRGLGVGLFAAQLVLNGAWSWLFFGLHRPGLALLDIIGLWGLIVATLAAFGRERRAAAVLLVPYLAWVTFAAHLNLEIWRLNP